MKNKNLFLVVTLAALSSCTTLYKSGQTPDDVYYSPARSIDEVAIRDNREEPENEQNNRYNSYNSEDRMIRMGITNSRWRSLSDDYGYNPYNYSYNNMYNSMYSNDFSFGRNHGLYNMNGNYYNNNINSIYYNDLYYNPYFNRYPVYLVPVTLVKPRVTTPRQVNLNGYGSSYNNVNAPMIRRNPSPSGQSSRSYNNSNKSSGLGSLLNKVFSPAPSNNTNNNNSYKNSDNSPQRTYTPAPSNSNSSNSNSGSSSGNSSGGRITRPN